MMTSRRLFSLALVSMFAASASAQKAESEHKPTNPEVSKALDAAKQDLSRAIAILEKALESEPGDRDALYLLGAMSFVQGDHSEKDSERIALFRKSTDAFTRLQKVARELTSYEKAFLARSRIAEACILASEGKSGKALEVLKQLLDAGFDDLNALYDAKELETVRGLPAFRVLMEESTRPEVLREMSSFQSFPFDFRLKDLDNQTVRLADFQGKVTIVDLWGTWCPPCRAEIPHFVELLEQYKDQGLQIIGVNCNEQGSADEVRQTIQSFLKSMKIDYPCVLNDGKTEDTIPGFQGYPTTLFLDRAGKVRMTLFGYTPKVKLEVIVTTLLAEAPKPVARAETSK